MVCHAASRPQCIVTHYDEFSGMSQWYVTQIVQDRQGMMWFSTWNGLDRYDGYEFQNFKPHVGDGIDLPSDRISDISLAADGSLRCYVDKRVFGFSTKTCSFYKLKPNEERRMLKYFENRHSADIGVKNMGKYSLYKDKFGTEWRIGSDGDMSYKDSSTGSYVDYPSSWNGASRIMACAADREGNLWMTSSYGVFKLKFSKQPYEPVLQDKPSLIRSIFIDNKKRCWMSGQTDGTVRLLDLQGNTLGYLGHDGLLHKGYISYGSPIYCIMQDSHGNYWLCSKPDGLYRLRETADGHFTINHFTLVKGDRYSLNDDSIYHCIEDNRGRLWVATFNHGINCIVNPSSDHPTVLNINNGLRLPSTNGMRVRQFHITRSNILLAATTSGLLIADISASDPRKITFNLHIKDVGRESSLSNNATMFVTEDYRHRVFVCTESGGINQILSTNLLDKELRFRHFNLSTGFPSDVALSAIAYGKELIVVSNNRVVRLNPDASGIGGSDSFFYNDHLRFSDAQPVLLPSGRMLFGLQDGAFSVDMSDLRKSSFVPPIAFTQLTIESGKPNMAVNAMDTLVLEPSYRDIFLQFAALDYGAQPSSLMYAFRLGTHNEPWNYIGKDHSVTFLDMKPGTYKLQIRSTNGDGVWVDNIRTLTIIVRPTFWETPMAKCLYILLVVIFIAVVWFTRMHIVNQNRRQKELHDAYLALLNSSHTSAGKTLVASQNQDGNNNSPSSVTNPQPSTLKPADEQFMQRAMKFIEEHLGDADINIGDLADATATSRSGLNRKMKQLLGVTPLDFIREARIRKACQLLKHGMPVNDVAYDCGFSDPKYFAKFFKAQMGMTPTEYKNKETEK